MSLIRWLVAAGLIVALAVGAGFWWIRSELETPYYAASEPVTYVEIPRGSATNTIAEVMQQAGVLHRSLPFKLYVRWQALGKNLQAGEYCFSTPATPVEIVQRLVHGDIYYIAVTIPEGLTALETIDHISKAGLGNLADLGNALFKTQWIRDLNPRARTLEGFLFPETYRFRRKATPDDIVRSMVDQFKAKFAKLRASCPPSNSIDIGDIVTLASMIEKEAGAAAERPLVASVFLNRIEKNMPLACDPTIIYALKLAGRYDGNIRKADLFINSPYNTYLHPGLPPGPIANPGEGSLRAALDPARTGYYFFVSRKDGTHQFSRNFQAHQAAVIRFQKSSPR